MRRQARPRDAYEREGLVAGLFFLMALGVVVSGVLMAVWFLLVALLSMNAPA